MDSERARHFLMELDRLTNSVDWGGLIRAQSQNSHERGHVNLESCMALRSFVEVDLGLSARLDDK